MTTQSLRLKISTPSLKLILRPLYPVSISAESPILLDTTGGNYQFSLDTDTLIRTLSIVFAAILTEPLIVTTGSGTALQTTTSVAVSRVAPSATTINLPAVATRNGLPLHVLDWSSSVTDHTITLTPSGTDKIMRASSFPLYSSASSLAAVTLYPSVNLGGWYY